MREPAVSNDSDPTLPRDVADVVRNDDGDALVCLLVPYSYYSYHIPITPHVANRQLIVDSSACDHLHEIWSDCLDSWCEGNLCYVPAYINTCQDWKDTYCGIEACCDKCEIAGDAWVNCLENWGDTIYGDDLEVCDGYSSSRRFLYSSSSSTTTSSGSSSVSVSGPLGSSSSGQDYSSSTYEDSSGGSSSTSGGSSWENNDDFWGSSSTSSSWGDSPSSTTDDFWGSSSTGSSTTDGFWGSSPTGSSSSLNDDFWSASSSGSSGSGGSSSSGGTSSGGGSSTGGSGGSALSAHFAGNPYRTKRSIEGTGGSASARAGFAGFFGILVAAAGLAYGILVIRMEPERAVRVEWESCCTFPHGMWRTIASMVFAVLAFCLAIGAMGAKFFVGYLPLFGVPVGFEAGQAFAILAFLLGFVCAVAPILACFLKYSPTVRAAIVVGYSVTAMLQIWTMFVYSSPYCTDPTKNRNIFGCGMMNGANASVFAFFFWILAAIPFLQMPHGTSLPTVISTDKTTASTMEGSHEDKKQHQDVEMGDNTATSATRGTDMGGDHSHNRRASWTTIEEVEDPDDDSVDYGVWVESDEDVDDEDMAKKAGEAPGKDSDEEAVDKKTSKQSKPTPTLLEQVQEAMDEKDNKALRKSGLKSAPLGETLDALNGSSKSNASAGRSSVKSGKSSASRKSASRKSAGYSSGSQDGRRAPPSPRKSDTNRSSARAASKASRVPSSPRKSGTDAEMAGSRRRQSEGITSNRRESASKRKSANSKHNEPVEEKTEDGIAFKVKVKDQAARVVLNEEYLECSRVADGISVFDKTSWEDVENILANKRESASAKLKVSTKDGYKYLLTFPTRKSLEVARAKMESLREEALEEFS